MEMINVQLKLNKKKNDILSIKFKGNWCLLYLFIILWLSLFVSGVSFEIKNNINNLFLFIPFYIVFIYLFTLSNSIKRKIEISKEENQNEKIILKIIHWYCNTISKEKNMKDIHFEIDKYDYGEGHYYRFFIINDFPNKEENQSEKIIIKIIYWYCNRISKKKI